MLTIFLIADSRVSDHVDSKSGCIVHRLENFLKTIYIYMCVCVYIYILCVCVCVCVCVCLYVCMYVCV